MLKRKESLEYNYLTIENIKYNIENNIITYEISLYPIWNNIGARIYDCTNEEVNKITNDTGQYWIPGPKRVILPDGMKLINNIGEKKLYPPWHVNIIDKKNNIISSISYIPYLEYDNMEHSFENESTITEK
jgi:hypothetical protein